MSNNLYTDGTYSEVYPTWHAEDSPWKAEQVMCVMEWPNLGRPIRICDVGCGVGGVLAALGDLLDKQGIQAELTGYDIAPEPIERARREWKDRSNLKFECADVLRVGPLDYDLCLFMDVLSIWTTRTLSWLLSVNGAFGNMSFTCLSRATI